MFMDYNSFLDDIIKGVKEEDFLSHSKNMINRISKKHIIELSEELLKFGLKIGCFKII